MDREDEVHNTSSAPPWGSGGHLRPHPPKKKAHWVPVVTGLIRRGPQILIGQRPENHSLAGMWEFPGGKIESGESPEKALARELFEELDIHAEIGSLLLSCTYSFPNQGNHNLGEINILILFFEVLYWRGEPKPKHHMKLEWVEPKELLHRPIPEANRKNLGRIFEILEHRQKSPGRVIGEDSFQSGDTPEGGALERTSSQTDIPALTPAPSPTPTPILTQPPTDRPE